jgi:hypothetical protein
VFGCVFEQDERNQSALFIPRPHTPSLSPCLSRHLFSSGGDDSHSSFLCTRRPVALLQPSQTTSVAVTSPTATFTVSSTTVLFTRCASSSTPPAGSKLVLYGNNTNTKC